MSRLHFVAVVAAPAIVVASPGAADAHFKLPSPPAWSVQDDLGGPQKSAPCGQADPGQPPSPSGTVTSFAPGDTVTITINEKIPHPGHYRVVLSTTGQSGLPVDPLVTAVGTDPCGSTVI